MADCQVESFVQKFRELWRDGLSTHLDLDCHAGEAWVGLRLRLGHHNEGDVQPRDQRDRHRESARRKGPSYFRRLQRRAAERNRVVATIIYRPADGMQRCWIALRENVQVQVKSELIRTDTAT